MASVPGYEFSDPNLLRQALTHPSLDGDTSYQRLEFLGDRVLGLVVADYLFGRFSDSSEGQLNQRFIALVRGKTVADISRQVGLDSRLHMAPGTEAEGGREKDNVLEDVGEAVIGAIYLDGGLEAARAYVLTHWEHALDQVNEARKDFKTSLQEWLQARGVPVPEYQDVGRTGPDHAPLFRVRVVTQLGEAEGEATSKKLAAQEAASKLLATLETSQPKSGPRRKKGKKYE